MSNEDSATHKNILAIKAHAERSREIVRSSEIKIMELKKTIISLKSEIEIFKTQIQAIQVKLYSGGATS